MGFLDASLGVKEGWPTGPTPPNHGDNEERERPPFFRDRSRDRPSIDSVRGVDRPGIFFSSVQVGLGRDISAIHFEVSERRGVGDQLYVALAPL